MSRLGETDRAYSRLVELLDQEIRKRRGSAKDLERFRETLDVAFYLLGWSQFEYLVRKAAEETIDEKAGSQTIERHAWIYLRKNLKSLSVRLRLDLIFHGKNTVLAGLLKDYSLRNEAAHDYRLLPKEARDVSAWLRSLEDLVTKF
jgi:hypothetical protein